MIKWKKFWNCLSAEHRKDFSACTTTYDKSLYSVGPNFLYNYDLLKGETSLEIETCYSDGN